jgi:beta-glucosidase
MTVDEKVGQMTQMTVTNFEERKTSVFDMVKLKTLFTIII